MRNLSAKREDGINRRGFLQSGATAALAASSWRRSLGANERIGIGMIGYGLIGYSHLEDFQEQPDVDMVAIAETHRLRREKAATLMGTRTAQYNDFREMLENRDVDAVVISTPDHWHALQSMLACAAGKDVYVEKPMTLFVREGRWMVEIAKRCQRVVMVGTQQRSGAHYQQARELIQRGDLGRIGAIHDNFHRNLMPGLGYPPDQDPPPELDWDLFLGPAPMRPYNPHRGIYHFRWFWDYSGGQMTNWGAHSMDIIDFYMNVKGPTAVFSSGSRSILRDNCETTDHQDTIFEYPGFHVTFSVREYCQGDSPLTLGFFGTHGSLRISRSGFKITPDENVPPVNVFPGVTTGEHPPGGPLPVRMSKKEEPRTKALTVRNRSQRDLLKLHARHFLDCIKSREIPVSDVESGHRVSTAIHLANISMHLGRKIVWDADREEIVGDPEAGAMLVRPYRGPWDEELKSLGISSLP